MQAFRRFTHRQFNNYLSILVIALALYIIIWPFLPAINLWWQRHTQPAGGYVYPTRLVKKSAVKSIPQDNRIVIPSLRMDEAINEGATAAALSKGIWHRPATGNPAQGSNTVLIGHRFTYSGQAVFYNLDKVHANDKIIVYWQGKEYDYNVIESRVVPAGAIEIEYPTEAPTLTLYTCTPLWTAKDRLVITARPL